MNTTFKELIAYIKYPILEEDTNKTIVYRLKKLWNLILISLATAFISLLIITLLDKLGWINLAEVHKTEELFKAMPKITVFFLAVIMAPLLEEIVFRAPLTIFKKGKQFRIAFYIIAILFGFIHISNYTISTNVLLFSPILILPQILLGFYLGFIRVRFGLIWAIALHALYNGILVASSLLEEFV